MEHLDKLMRLLENESVDYKEVTGIAAFLCDPCTNLVNCVLQLDEIKDSVDYYIESHDVMPHDTCACLFPNHTSCTGPRFLPR